MAVTKLPSGNYQARLQGKDGTILSQTFPSRLEAQEQVLKWKKEKRAGHRLSNSLRQLTVNEFFDEWHSDSIHDNASGWREIQAAQYDRYVRPIIGKSLLQAVTPQMVRRVLKGVASKGKSKQLERHVYVLLRKFFGDAIENYHYLTFNPALRKFRPEIALKEARHLNLEETRLLLKHVENRKYGLAIWLQLYLGLRVGELQALRWDDLDFSTGRVTIRRTYVNKLNQFKDYPKGKKQHSHSVPAELLAKLQVRWEDSDTELVVTSPIDPKRVLPHKHYLTALKRYCREAKVTEIGTHGLRHSTSELYMHHGATKDDLQKLFAHSTASVTERYIHDRGTNLEKVAKVIQLFENESTMKIDHDEVKREGEKG